jgi:hypothetical protein
VYVGSPGSGQTASLTLGRGGVAVESALGVIGAPSGLGGVAGDTQLATVTGNLILGVQGTLALSATPTALFAGHPLAMSSNKITGLLDPTAAQDAATKNYSDKLLGYAEATANATSSSTTTGNDAWGAGLSITVTADGVRSIELEAFCSVASNNTAGDGCQMSIYEGATQIATATMTAGTASKGVPLNPKRTIAPGAAGSRTFTVKLNAVGGGTATFSAAAPPGIATPAWIKAKHV